MKVEVVFGAHGSRGIVVLVSALLTLLPPPMGAQSNSTARVVRLSFVEGTVRLQRPNLSEWVKAFINTPIQQGFRLSTDAKSFAEVEFENGSTARLGQACFLEFSELSLAPSGSKINRMTLTRGYATFTVASGKGDVYEVQTAGGNFTARGKSVFRIDLDLNAERLEVFKGEVAAASAYGSGTLGKGEVLTVIPGDSLPYQTTHGITQDAWDQWVSQRNERRSLVANNIANGNPYESQHGSLYGWNDLVYYGNWTYLPGYGYGWIPFVSYGWSPYTVGFWSWYPGFGYTWISVLPWGWVPFHYGNWAYLGDYGWCWMPGSIRAWSPGVVQWYQGQNWIGWYPDSGKFTSAGEVGCASSANCATVVRMKTFRNDEPYSLRSFVSSVPSAGRLVPSPDVRPTQRLLLPGPVLRHGNPPSALRSFHAATTVSTGTGSQAFAGGTGGVHAPSRILPRLPGGFGTVNNHFGVFFNPQSGQFERAPIGATSSVPVVRMWRNSSVPGSREQGTEVFPLLPRSRGGTEEMRRRAPFNSTPGGMTSQPRPEMKPQMEAPQHERGFGRRMPSGGMSGMGRSEGRPKGGASPHE